MTARCPPLCYTPEMFSLLLALIACVLDGAAYRDKGDELDFRAVGHLSTRDVAAVLERTRDRMVRHSSGSSS